MVFFMKRLKLKISVCSEQTVRETVAARKACVFPYCFIFPIKRAGEGMGGLGGRETPLALGAVSKKFIAAKSDRPLT